MAGIRIISREPTILDRWENGDDRHMLACVQCGYFDRLLRLSPGPKVVAVIAHHVLYDHELPG